MGSELGLESANNKGSAFWVNLLLAEHPLHRNATPQCSTAKPTIVINTDVTQRQIERLKAAGYGANLTIMY